MVFGGGQALSGTVWRASELVTLSGEPTGDSRMAMIQDISKSSTYQDKLMGLLAGRDPMAVQRQTADVLDGMVRANSVADLQARPFEGKWTPTEIVWR